MTRIDFAILNSYVTVIYLRFIKTTNFYVVKQKTLKYLWHFSLLFILVYKMCLFPSKKTVNRIRFLLDFSSTAKIYFKTFLQLIFSILLTDFEMQYFDRSSVFQRTLKGGEGSG